MRIDVFIKKLEKAQSELGNHAEVWLNDNGNYMPVEDVEIFKDIGLPRNVWIKT